MFSLIPLVIHTANILGIFADPFEFEGDYGPEVNPVRETVFELVISPEAQARQLNDPFLITQAIEQEKVYGPTLSQLVPEELLNDLRQQQTDLAAIETFVTKYRDCKVFRFFRNCPQELLSMDKILRDDAARAGRTFDLPVLGSTTLLEGSDSLTLKRNLLHAVFSEKTLSLAKPQESIEKALSKLPDQFLSEYLGEGADTQDLQTFSSPVGQAFFFWMYQSLNLHLISVHPDLIEQVNNVKQIFANTLGDPIARAHALKEKLIAADTSVLFTQESDDRVVQTLTSDGLFHPVEPQNPKDGTLVFLRSDIWEPHYTIVPIEGYEGFNAGRMNVILATLKGTDQKFLLAACHGHSTRSEDGRLQISLIMEKYLQLNDGTLQLLIGIDANTKSEEDVALFREHLDSLGLMCTEVGPTTVKRRMSTAQHGKACKLAIDEEDYLITLKPQSGGYFDLANVTVGFKEPPVDINKALPNLDNPSDHYPVGATLLPL